MIKAYIQKLKEKNNANSEIKKASNEVYMQEKKKQELIYAREKAKIEYQNKISRLKEGKPTGFFSNAGKGFVNLLDDLTKPPKATKKSNKDKEKNVFKSIDVGKFI